MNRLPNSLFVSYAEPNRPIAIDIATLLRDAGYHVTFDQWSFPPGSDFVGGIQEALTECERMIAVLSPAYLTRPYTSMEWQAFMTLDPNGKNELIIPVRVEDFRPDGIFASRVYVDFVGATKKKRHANLLAAVQKRPLQPPPGIPDSYRQWLERQCAKVELLGMRLREGQAVRLSHVYVPITTAAAPPPMEDEPRKSRGKRKKPAGVEAALLGDAVQREQLELLLHRLDEGSMFIPGAPGSGKSTFCRWVAYLACTGKIPAHDVPPPKDFTEVIPKYLTGSVPRLPLLVPLRDFWKSLPRSTNGDALPRAELEQALVQWVSDQRPGDIDGELVAAHLAYGSLLLILDGLDEVPPSDGDASAASPHELLIAALTTALPEWTRRGNRVLLTSRPYGLNDRQEALLGLPRAKIEELPPALRELLVLRWFHALAAPGESGRGKGQALLDHIAERAELEPLTANPMLLTAMCVIFDQGMKLPDDRHELYDQVIAAVLSNRYRDNPSLMQLERSRLAVIAYGMHTGAGLDEERATPQAEVTTKELELMLRAYQEQDDWTESSYEGVVITRDRLLSQSGLLLSSSHDRAAFYHLTLQEFLAAQRLLDVEGDRLAEQFVRRAAESNWHMTLSFAFNSLLSTFSTPTRGIKLLRALLEKLDTNPQRQRANIGDTPTAAPGLRVEAEDPRLRVELGSLVGLAVVVADCLEVARGRQIGLPDEALRRFHTFCLAAIEQEVPLAERVQIGRALGRVGDPRIHGLRDPAAYVEVPAGDSYIYGQEKQPLTIVEPFLLGRFPVTNGQYREFMNDGGYHDPDQKWWSPEGRQWREKDNVMEPRYWRDRKWNGATQPVVGVSFYEAEACAAWAGGRLPTEQEWEAAARGKSGWEWPWGNDWQDGDNICNTYEAKLGTTSPVGIFPRSRSVPLGLEEMAGNVWEWCASWFNPQKPVVRVLRGGSWFSLSQNARAAIRVSYPPDLRVNDFGFRVVVCVRTLGH